MIVDADTHKKEDQQHRTEKRPLGELDPFGCFAKWGRSCLVGTLGIRHPQERLQRLP